MRQERVIQEARFDEKLPVYWMTSTLLVLALTIVGLPLVPIWLVLGWRIHRKQYECLECTLTDRSVRIRRGFLFRVEKHVPLDKIQDVSMKEGPILRWLGLASLVVETAGQSSAQGTGDATLVGVVDAPAFRDAILERRDLVVASAEGGSRPEPGSPDPLVEIRDSLRRIEGLIERAIERRVER